MKRRNAIGAVLVAVLALGAGMYAFAAPRAGAARTSNTITPVTMTISATGQKQGAITGKTPLPLLSVSHEIISPRDPASGLPTGKRQHKPLVVTMELGPTTPKFLTALVNNENLPTVQIGLLRSGTPVATIKLTNANVSHYVLSDQTVQFDFVYQKITWTWLAGGITAQDDWEATVG